MKVSAKDKLYAEFKKDKTVRIGVGDAVAWFLNSGHYVLNWVLSGRYDGGWPSGTVNELFGDPQTGKSLIIVKAMERLQKGDITVVDDSRVTPGENFIVLDDTENAYHESFCKLNGLDPDDLIKLVSTKTVERHFQQVEEKVNTIRNATRKSPIAIFCDSVSQLSTETEVKGGMEKEDMGRKAKKVHQAMRLYSDAIGIDQLLYLLASHVIDSYAQWGPKRKVKGGGGLAFQSTVRVDLKWMKLFVRNMMETRDLKKKGETFGARTLATAVKNRVAPPHRFAIMDVYYDRGLDPYSGLLDHLVRQGRVTLKKKATKGASIWRLDGKDDFLEDELEKLVADQDVLGIKKAGKKYMDPIRVLGDVSQEDIEEGADELPPPPPPPAPVRKAAEEE